MNSCMYLYNYNKVYMIKEKRSIKQVDTLANSDVNVIISSDSH